MAMLEVRKLRTSFFTDAGEVKAVDGVSFNLDRGKVLGIVGESGSGKSVTAYSIMQIPSAIFTESFLSFVGMGVSMPMPSLGSLASDARSGLISYPYLLMFPAGTIFLNVLSFNLLGNGLRDAFDPKLRS